MGIGGGEGGGTSRLNGWLRPGLVDRSDDLIAFYYRAGSEGDVEEDIDQGVVGGGEGAEVSTGRARGGPQLESGE